MSAPTARLQTELFDPGRSRRRALVLLAIFALVHSWAVRGYTGVFWGVHGRWLHEVERFARGEVPYRDFTWDSPPLALWIVGGLARITSTGLATITAITTAISFVLLGAFFRLTSRVAPGTTLPAVLTGFVFAAAYANRLGPPLPLGTGALSGPVGVLCLLLAAALTVSLLQRPTPTVAALAGVAEGLTILTEQDFWLAGLYLLVSGLVILRRRRTPLGVTGTLTGAFFGVVIAGALFTAVAAGVSPLVGIRAGAGGTLDSFLRGVPSWERLTVEAATTCALGLIGVAALWLCLALDDARAARWAGVLLLGFMSAAAIHLGMSVAVARSLAAVGPRAPLSPLQEALVAALSAGRSTPRAALFVLDQRFQQHLFPIVLPPLLIGILLARWRRWTNREMRVHTLLLLGLCLAARVHRGFGGTDWYDALLAIPAYALFLRLVAATVGREAQRSVSAALAILLVMGMYAYYSLGRGPLTLRGGYPVTVTERGMVRWPASEAGVYRAVRDTVNRLDPLRSRPLVATSQTGGWNYFLARRNPTPLTGGFLLVPEAAPILERARSDPRGIVIVDTRRFFTTAPPPRPTLTGWEPARVEGQPLLEQATFERFVRGCRRVPVTPTATDTLLVYDCPPRAASPTTPPGSSR